MSDFSRRDLIRTIAAAAVIGGGVTEAAAQEHVHLAASDEKAETGIYNPKAFTPAEYAALGVLCELIVPGATIGGAKEYIDLLSSQNQQLTDIYTGGIAWLNHYSLAHFGNPFASAKVAQQTELLDRIAYQKNASPELSPGIQFFGWARRMTVDAYYSSKAGIQELGYKGNVGMAKFEIPQEAIDYALKKSGL